MKRFVFGAALAIGIVSFGAVASANPRGVSAGTTGQSVMRSFETKQRDQSSQQVNPQSNANPDQPSSVSAVSTQQFAKASRRGSCTLRPVTAGGQAKEALAAVQACPNQ
ncbi:hypothetical protein NIES2135_62370 (plasmid) [Leptolyngbya boryana NIES-2135]|uniref:Uncharacterized protein n=2 Tax=Leptolyngbya group TaxID=3081713 RepID=A0A1Z4JRL5_LEPBY|nr:hypothetical protein [Leptolyngbya boryana]MBD2372948.1 hypothetical protein [Leptolyngbya sp. FACHB-238]MBD2397299.1 hypothetical protein [Leptolyngbya sp. FACHB-239]MBD2403896.1 hypothetical protein [Leptolyngbya sp. FACHB-402]BAY59360.1 hypothetical protein NIES2135_62370 [Leptolyngbya boryana NIES-2135]ULP33192.1 hypothetical protein MCP04_30960 [Leptolyngbya boryana IU 594]